MDFWAWMPQLPPLPRALRLPRLHGLSRFRRWRTRPPFEINITSRRTVRARAKLPLSPEDLETNVLRRREILSTGMIQRRNTGRRRATAIIKMPARIKNLLDHHHGVKENKRVHEDADRAFRQLLDKRKLEHIRAKDDKGHSDESTANLAQELQQRQLEMTNSKHVYSKSLSKQRSDEQDLLELLKGSSSVHVSHVSLAALEAANRGRIELGKQNILRKRMYEDMVVIKDNARRALHELGLRHFERDFALAKERVAAVENSMRELEASIRGSSNAFYSSLAKDLVEMKRGTGAVAAEDDVPHDVKRPSDPHKGNEELQDVETNYDKACKKLTQTWKGHDWYRDQYSGKLSQKISDAIDELQGEMAQQADEVRAAAAHEYLKEWQAQIHKLQEIEEVFIQRRKAAVTQRIRERAVNSEFVDVPIYQDHIPGDGMTDSMSPQAIELRDRRFLEKRSFVEEWVQQADGSSDVHFQERTVDEVESENMTPWESLSCVERLPQRRKRIDDYRTQAAEVSN